MGSSKRKRKCAYVGVHKYYLVVVQGTSASCESRGEGNVSLLLRLEFKRARGSGGNVAVVRLLVHWHESS